MRKFTKKFTVSSEQNNKWYLWSYADSESEYTEYVNDIESKGYRARVIDRETKVTLYITK
jgi:hypothetical protein